MKFTTIILLVMFLFVACESPMDSTPEQITYRGQIVQDGSAPFLLDRNSLAKDSDGTLVIDDAVADGTVYGQSADSEVYAASGGEVLPKDTWVDNISADPIEVSLKANLIITFEHLTEVTVIDAMNMFYVDASGAEVLFSGTGVITAIQIITGPDGSVTLISSTKFSIGGDGGEIA